MASEYLKYLNRDVKPEGPPPELTPKEKRRNWWYYHWKIVAVVCIIVLAGVFHAPSQSGNHGTDSGLSDCLCGIHPSPG